MLVSLNLPCVYPKFHLKELRIVNLKGKLGKSGLLYGDVVLIHRVLLL